MPMHIVHVEDDTALNDILKITINAAEPTADLKQFISGDDALPYIEQHRDIIDLFILDIRLPGKSNGLEIAQEIRKLSCPGFIMMTSAFSSPEQQWLANHKAEFVPKPWHILELTQTLLKYRLKGPEAPSAKIEAEIKPASPSDAALQLPTQKESAPAEGKSTTLDVKIGLADATGIPPTGESEKKPTDNDPQIGKTGDQPIKTTP